MRAEDVNELAILIRVEVVTFGRDSCGIRLTISKVQWYLNISGSHVLCSLSVEICKLKPYRLHQCQS